MRPVSGLSVLPKAAMTSCSFTIERWSSIINRIDLMNGSKKQEDAIRLRIILTSFIDVVEWIIKYELPSRRNLPTRDPASPDLQRHIQFVCIAGRRGFMNPHVIYMRPCLLSVHYSLYSFDVNITRSNDRSNPVVLSSTASSAL